MLMSVQSTAESDRAALVLEDDILIALTIEDYLSRSGVESVLIADDAAAALDYVATRHFDVAVVDWVLKRETSEAVIDALNARGIPVLVATGMNEKGLPERIAGANSIIEKPFDENSFIKALRALPGVVQSPATAFSEGMRSEGGAAGQQLTGGRPCNGIVMPKNGRSLMPITLPASASRTQAHAEMLPDAPALK